MVALDFYQKLTRHLELYLMQQANFKLPVKGYDLIALLPVSPDYMYDEKHTLLVSASQLNNISRRTGIYGLLSNLRSGLLAEDYSTIFNVDLIETNSNLVKRVNAHFAQSEDRIYELPISFIGGVTNQSITVIKSTVLPQLQHQESYEIGLTYAGSFQGKLESIDPMEHDAGLLFSTPEGQRYCTFTDIERLKHIPPITSQS